MPLLTTLHLIFLLRQEWQASKLSVSPPGHLGGLYLQQPDHRSRGL